MNRSDIIVHDEKMEKEENKHIKSGMVNEYMRTCFRDQKEME